jgi:hypothetical protein
MQFLSLRDVFLTYFAVAANLIQQRELMPIINLEHSPPREKVPRL